MQNQLSHQRKNTHESTWGWERPQTKKIHKHTIQTHSKGSCSFLRHAAPQNPTALNFILRTKSDRCDEEWQSHSLSFFLPSFANSMHLYNKQSWCQNLQKVQPHPFQAGRSQTQEKSVTWQVVSLKAPFPTQVFRISLNAKQLHVLMDLDRVLQATHGSDHTLEYVKKDEKTSRNGFQHVQLKVLLFSYYAVVLRAQKS